MAMLERIDEMVTYIPHLRRYAHALTQNTPAADDLVQDCLQRAMERVDQFQPGTNLRAWLFTIMHSIFVNQWRRRMRRGTEVGLEEWSEGNHCEPGQESRIAILEIQTALSALPKDSQAILLLVGVEGFSYQEASEVLGVPLGTVRSRLSRAREMLRMSLQKESGETNEPDPSPPCYPIGCRRPLNSIGERTRLLGQRTRNTFWRTFA